MDLTGVRVLMVSTYYAPETTGNAPYATGLATFLHQAGAKVTVVTGVPHYPQWQRQKWYSRIAVQREVRPEATLLRTPHFVPRVPNAANRALYEVTFGATSRLASRRGEFDVVIGMTPTLAGGATAIAAARRCRAPAAIVVQDVVSSAAAQLGVTGGGTVANATASIEGTILRKADAVVIIAPSFADPVGALGVEPSRVRLIPNWTHIAPDPSTPDEARQRLGWNDTGLVVVHTGNMGNKQGLDNVVEAARLADARNEPITFVLVGDGNQRRHLERRAANARSIRFVPPVSDEWYPTTLAAADVLLVNEVPAMVGISLPSKVTSYVVAGRPIVGAVPSSGDTADLLRRTGAAVLVEPGQPELLLEALLQLAAAPLQRHALSASARSFAGEHLGAQRAAHNYIDLVQQLLKH